MRSSPAANNICGLGVISTEWLNSWQCCCTITNNYDKPLENVFKNVLNQVYAYFEKYFFYIQANTTSANPFNRTSIAEASGPRALRHRKRLNDSSHLSWPIEGLWYLGPLYTSSKMIPLWPVYDNSTVILTLHASTLSACWTRRKLDHISFHFYPSANLRVVDFYNSYRCTTRHQW